MVFKSHRMKVFFFVIVLVGTTIFMYWNLDAPFYIPVLIFALDILCFCFCCCQCPHTRGLPSDATPVESPEKEDILNELAGEWDIVPVKVPTYVGRQRPFAFAKVYVTGTQLTFSGGPEGSTHTDNIYLSRTPAGTLYIDNYGSYIKVWNKIKQEITINTGLNATIIWRRQQSGVLATRAAPAIQLPVVIALPSWWEILTDANGKVYYRNNHKMTTSWTPPSPEQIAEETRERNAQTFGEIEGLPPPAYNPAYNPPPVY